ncbi:MAG: hypothetical protein VYE77_11685 [Planctomycetota bacterium]|nr:hypothetical protein [Planctomycetota bacterium]
MRPRIGILLCLAPAAAAQSYFIEDIGTLSATASDGVRAAAINNRGQVHGENDKTAPGGAGVQWRSYLWDGAVQHEIFPAVSGSTWSGGVNDSSYCVGKYTVNTLSMHGYFWHYGPIFDVDIGTRDFTHIHDVNVDGNCVGTFTSDQVWGYVYRYHAFVFTPAGLWLDLGTLGGYESRGRALNDWNQAVGWARDAAGHHLGFLWTWPTGMVDIGNLGGFYCDPEDLDNWGRIVGASADPLGNYRPFLWENGVMNDLGTLGGTAGRARGINDFGVVVGTARDASETGRAVIWENGSVADLNSLIAPGSGWELTGARDINELGEIAGTGLRNGVQRAYRLTPILARPRLSGFQPGFAGRNNTLFGIGFTPGATVEIYAGFVPGSTVVPCGATVDIGNAFILGALSADASGRIEGSLYLPSLASGLRAYLQSVEPPICGTGERLTQQLQ